MKTYYKSHNDTSIDNIADSSADNSDDNGTVLPSKTLIIHLLKTLHKLDVSAHM